VKTSNIMVSLIMDLFLKIPFIDYGRDNILKDISIIKKQLGDKYILSHIFSDKINGLSFGVEKLIFIEVYARDIMLHPNYNTNIVNYHAYVCTYYKIEKKICGRRDMRREDVEEFCRAFVPYILSEGEDVSEMLRLVNIMPEAAAYAFRGDDVTENK